MVRGSHSDNVLLLLGVLGAFDALYASSFLLDAAAVFVDGRSTDTYSTLNTIADFLFAYATCTSLLSAILAWYLYRAFVWAAEPEPMRSSLLRLIALATFGKRKMSEHTGKGCSRNWARDLLHPERESSH